MVHNGIEYGDMQLIAETYDVMRRALGMPAPEMAEVFDRWNEGKLESFLVEITGKVLKYVDPLTDKPLVDVILDKAAQKGTGRWTSQNSFELGTPIPVIDAAVVARSLSSFKERRLEASKVIKGPGSEGMPFPETPDKQTLIDALENALYVAKITSYAQGMALLASASETYNWDLNLSELARIWTGGCIIRAELLHPIMDAFKANPDLANLMLDDYFAEAVNNSSQQLRHVISTAIAFGIPTPAMNAALSYIDTLRQPKLPADLIQGLRDYFGAHTYERVDREGTFHTEWMEVEKEQVKQPAG
jgi:6-phosphogluconate dehydrogenase